MAPEQQHAGLPVGHDRTGSGRRPYHPVLKVTAVGKLDVSYPDVQPRSGVEGFLGVNGPAHSVSIPGAVLDLGTADAPWQDRAMEPGTAVSQRQGPVPILKLSRYPGRCGTCA